MSSKTKTAITVISKISDKAVSRAAAMVVIHGDELGRKFDLIEGATSIGRGAKSDIRVDHEAVSRNHAKLENHEGRVLLTDLGSTNGSFVNDETIRGEFRLRNGDLIKIGRTVFKFLASNNLEAAYHDEIYRLTTVDGLTQVNNRRFFEEALEREISRCRRHGRGLALAMFDIDHFKRINDEHGHLAGDVVLKEVATLLKTRVRREDIVARYGGEEFAVIIPEVEVKGVLTLAEKLRRAIERAEFTFDGVTIPVTVSIGVAVLPKRGEEPKALLKRADEQLYAAKEAGRNQVCSA